MKLIDTHDHILSAFDRQIAGYATNHFRRSGIELVLNCRVSNLSRQNPYSTRQALTNSIHHHCCLDNLPSPLWNCLKGNGHFLHWVLCCQGQIIWAIPTAREGSFGGINIVCRSKQSSLVLWLWSKGQLRKTGRLHMAPASGRQATRCTPLQTIWHRSFLMVSLVFHNPSRRLSNSRYKSGGSMLKSRMKCSTALLSCSFLRISSVLDIWKPFATKPPATNSQK